MASKSFTISSKSFPSSLKNKLILYLSIESLLLKNIKKKAAQVEYKSVFGEDEINEFLEENSSDPDSDGGQKPEDNSGKES